MSSKEPPFIGRTLRALRLLDSKAFTDAANKALVLRHTGEPCNCRAGFVAKAAELRLDPLQNRNEFQLFCLKGRQHYIEPFARDILPLLNSST